MVSKLSVTVTCPSIRI